LWDNIIIIENKQAIIVDEEIGEDVEIDEEKDKSAIIRIWIE